MKPTKAFLLFLAVVSILACSLLPVSQSTNNTGNTSSITETETLQFAEGETPTPTFTDSPPVITSTSTEEMINTIDLLPNNMHIESEEPKYTINLNYPYLSGSASLEPINQAVHEMMESEQNTFLQIVQDNEEWRKENMPGAGSDLYSEFTTHYNKNNLLSFQFTISVYIAGAAHPNSYFHVLTYDVENLLVLTLEDIFLPGSNYLEFLSSYSINYLSENGYIDFPEGAEPAAENFRNWNITENGLLISFDPYQVAPYAAGPQQVLIPYSELNTLLDMNGPAARLQN